MARPVGGKKLDVTRAYRDVALRGMSYAEAGAVQGVHKSAIHQALARHADLDEVKRLRAERPDKLDALADMLVSLLNADAAKRMVDRQPGAAALWFNSLLNQSRLDRGEATQIMDVRDIQVRIEAIHARLAGQMAGQNTANDSREEAIDVPCLSADKKSVDISNG